MGLLLLFIILALLFGVGGLLLEGLKWLLIIAVIFLVLGVVTGARGRGGV